MKNSNKGLMIFSALIFGLAFTSILIGAIAERIARLNLTPERQTPEAIQYYYDGTVCQACEPLSLFVAILIIACGVISLVLSAFIDSFQARQKIK